MRYSDKKKKLILLKKTFTGQKMTRNISKFRIFCSIVYETKNRQHADIVFELTLNSLIDIIVSLNSIINLVHTANHVLNYSNRLYDYYSFNIYITHFKDLQKLILFIKVKGKGNICSLKTLRERFKILLHCMFIHHSKEQEKKILL